MRKEESKSLFGATKVLEIMGSRLQTTEEVLAEMNEWIVANGAAAINVETIRTGGNYDYPGIPVGFRLFYSVLNI